MQVIYLLRANQFYPIFKGLEDHGECVQDYLRQAGISQEILADPKLTVAGYPVRRLISLIDRNVGIADFGYETGEKYGLEALEPILGRAINCSRTLFDFLRNICDLQDRLVSHPAISFIVADEGAYLCRTNPEGVPLGRDTTEQFVIAQMIQLVRYILGKDWNPRQVWLEREDLEFKFDQSLDKPMIFRGQHHSMFFIPNSELEHPVKPIKVLMPLWPTIRESSAGKAVKLAIRPYLEEGLPTLDQAVDLLGVSKRTLQRMLAEESLTYRELVLEIRMEYACRRLRNGSEAINQISHKLDYASPAHFSRAFSRWKDCSPGHYRLQIQSIH
jgi:AraC-like DNA-binding protein